MAAPTDTGLRPLLTVSQLAQALSLSVSWIYRRTGPKAIDPIPVVRLGKRGVRFNPDHVLLYIRSRERHPFSDRMGPSDGIARVNGKGFKLTRKRFQTGTVRLREDRDPVWWEAFYREDVITESGRVKRIRKSVKLGLLKDIPSEAQAKRRLAQILVNINSDGYRPKSVITFRGFVQKYRELKMATKKGTTQHGYENNIRLHYLPHFGDWLLSEIDAEAVQRFLNLKQAAGKSWNTLKNLKWGLSSIFTAAVKYGYIQSNPVRGADLPPEEIREQAQLPNHGQLNLLIENLPEPASTAVWLVAVACVRPEELAFKWTDLDAEKRMLWVVRAVNRGKLHTPKYHRTNRPIRLTEADVERLLTLKRLRKAKDDDWMFPNRIKNAGKKMKPGPMWHEDLLGRVIQPVAEKLGLPHVTWRLLRHWGATEMVEAKVPIKAAQERLGHSRPDVLLKFYAHVLDASADEAAATLSQGLGAKSAALEGAYRAAS
jgi:integrase/predicted DNA-binding transcriptional regulator AlpA